VALADIYSAKMENSKLHIILRQIEAIEMLRLDMVGNGSSPFFFFFVCFPSRQEDSHAIELRERNQRNLGCVQF
jgi:hypothetical protein